MLSDINNQQQTCSILVGNFNAKLSRWHPSDKGDKAGQELVTLGYNQMIGQPANIINDKSSCSDLLFTINSKLPSDVGVEQTIYDKCHYNIVYGPLNYN